MPLDMKFGLNSTGLLVPTYEEVLDTVQVDLQRRAGTKIPLAGNSNFGMLSEFFSYHLSKYYQQLQMVYYSAYVSTAIDSGLDRLAANASLTRKPDSASEVELYVVTDGQYLIETGTQFETENGIVFDVMDNTLTELQSDGTYSAMVDAIADEVGSFSNVPANTITVVSDPDEDIISVNNPKASNGGDDRETDDRLRRRIIMDTSAYPSATINGIKSALLNVPGVREVNDIANPTGDTDAYGNPPYTVHLYVLGGAKSDILEALAKYSGYGPLFVGSESGEVADLTGDKKKYYFDYATPVPIYVNVQVKTNNSWDSDSGQSEIKDLISEYINNLAMGANVVVTKMYPDIYSLEGVEEATITIGREPGKLDTADIQVERFEAPQGSADWITVGDPNTPVLKTKSATTTSITLDLG